MRLRSIHLREALRIRLVPLLALSALATLSVASEPTQSADYSRRVWQMEDGLPHGRVQALSQTADGYLWIGTSGGLVRFDGVRFTVFDRSSTPALGDDSVLSLFASRDGSLWIGTEGGGVVHYTGRKFTAYSRQHGLTNLFVRSIVQDRAGTLWICTDRGLFYRKDGRFHRIDGTPDVPYVAGHVQEDSSGQLWVSGNALFRVEGGRVRRISDRFPSGGRSILEQPDGSHWLATSVGMFKVRGTRLDPMFPTISVPTSLLRDLDGKVWIGAANGLFLARESSVTRFTAAEPLPNSVLCLFRDRESNIWVGTMDGLTRFSRKLVSTIRQSTAGDEGVVAIYRDPSDRMLLVSGAGELYELENQRLVRRMIPGLPPDTRIRTVLEDRRGCFWIGTSNSGFYRSRCGPLTSYNITKGLRSNNVRALLQDRTGALWIGTGSGLARLEHEKLTVYYTDQGLAYGSVRSLLEDRDGVLWVGTDGGVSRIHAGKFLADAPVKALAGERIWALHQDSEGAIWVGTRGRGLFQIAEGEVRELGSKPGLPKSIHQILEDAAGNLWLSGPSGVVSARREELALAASRKSSLVEISAYGSAEGMLSTQMSGGVQPAGAISGTGEIWFPSVQGAVAIRSAARPASQVPLVLVEDVSIDRVPVDFTGGVRIPPGTGRLEIAFTAPKLLSPERIAFWYKLEGFDQDWIYAPTRRVASYTSLKPGEYKFRLMARDLAAPDRPSETSVAVEWLPRFSQTWSAWVLAILAAIGLVCLGFLMYARQTRQRYALILAERARLAREMHDTVIQGCVGVSTLLEAASSVEQTNKTMLAELINRARQEVRVTLEEARQAVWNLRHDTVGGKLLDSLPAFAAQMSSESGVAIEVEVVGTPVVLDNEVDRNLLAAAREAIRNAVAHAKPKQVRVAIYYAPEYVRIEVSDDGVGFEVTSPQIAPGHYGLLGMRERMERLGGSLLLLSQRSQGTRVIAEVPLSGRPA